MPGVVLVYLGQNLLQFLFFYGHESFFVIHFIRHFKRLHDFFVRVDLIPQLSNSLVLKSSQRLVL